MYISWQILNKYFKGKISPTTDGGYMYATRGPSGTFHVKWHKIGSTSPVVDRFHVTYEATGDKSYYFLTNGAVSYCGNRPNSGAVSKATVEGMVGAKYLYEYDDIAKAFLGAGFSPLRLKLSEAKADDAAVDDAAIAQKDRAKIIGELRTRYHNYSDSDFSAAGLTKVPVSQRYEWTTTMYAECFAKIEAAKKPAEATATTVPSSAVSAGTTVPLPPPKGMTVTPGAVTTITKLPTTS